MPTVQWITPVVDRTLEDCVYGSQRGALTVEVLLRIENNIRYLKELFDEANISYNTDIVIDETWERKRYFRIDDLRRIEQNVKNLRQSMLVNASTPDFPLSYENQIIDYEHINAIEQICLDLTQVYERVLKDRLFCGEFWCGYNRDGLMYEIGGGDARLATGVTFTVEQVGGEFNEKDSSHIKITFSEPVTYFKASAVTIHNIQGVAVAGELTGSGTTYLLALQQVDAQGMVEVQIAPFGDFYCTVDTARCIVYNERKIIVTAINGTALYGVDSYLTFHVFAENTEDGIYPIILDPAIPGAITTAVTLKDCEGTFTVFIPASAASGVYIETITIDGIISRQFSIIVMAEDFMYTGPLYVTPNGDRLLDDGPEGKAPYATPITFTAKQMGGAPDTQSSVAILLTFSQEIEYLTAADIEVINDVGEVTTGQLRGGAAAWVLELDSVTLQGNVYVKVNHFACYQVLTPAQAVEVYKGKSIVLNLVAGALAAKHEGTLEFTLTCDGIPDGSYTVEVVEAPSFLSFSTVNIAEGSGLLRVSSSAASEAGAYDIRLRIAGVTSTSYKLYVAVDDFLYSGFAIGGSKDDQHFEAGLGAAKLAQTVTYTAVQQGGIDGVSTTHSIAVTFSAPVEFFTVAAIHVESLTGKADIALLVGEGTDWIIQLKNVTQQGTIKLTIDSFGDFLVATPPQILEIYVTRTAEFGEQLTAIAASLPGVLKYQVLLGGFTDGVYTPTLSGFSEGTTVDPLKVTNGIGMLVIHTTVDKPGKYTGTMTVLGIEAEVVYYISASTSLATGFFEASNDIEEQILRAADTPTQSVACVATVEQYGGLYGESTTTAIHITFDKAVTGFTKEAISITSLGAEATFGELTGEGAAYSLEVLSVLQTGDLQIDIAGFANFFVTNGPFMVPLYSAGALVVGEQQGAIAEGLPGMVSFSVTALGIDDGTYPLTILDAPVNLLVPVNFTIKNGRGTLRLYTDGLAKAGKYYPRIEVEGVQSNAFLLAITN